MSHELSNIQTHSSSQNVPPQHKQRSLDHIDPLASLDSLLKQTLYRSRCPSAETLDRFEEQLLPDLESKMVAAHLDSCEDCSAELATLRAWLTELADPTPIERTPFIETAKQYIADLITPTHPIAPVMHSPRGVSMDSRSVQPNVTQYIYLVSVETSVPIMVDIEKDEKYQGQFKLIGQSTFQTVTPLKAALWRNGEADPFATGEVSDLGEFCFENLDAGLYELILSNEESEIYLRDIMI